MMRTGPAGPGGRDVCGMALERGKMDAQDTCLGLIGPLPVPIHALACLLRRREAQHDRRRHLGAQFGQHDTSALALDHCDKPAKARGVGTCPDGLEAPIENLHNGLPWAAVRRRAAGGSPGSPPGAASRSLCPGGIGGRAGPPFHPPRRCHCTACPDALPCST